MTLTVCVGASGSGKTTFLNDVHKSHKCIYIRQYHSLRPYIVVNRIPNFDPVQLPYWDTYVREEKTESIQVGGTMAGEFTAGLSGGQRKLLLFELIHQRTASQKDLLIVLDEPFAGVTDDFVPFITERLNSLRQNNNILLVTNDHVNVLTAMADNTITVSAIDRTKVKVNQREAVDREVALAAMSLGKDYHFESASSSDWSFFWDVEVASNKQLLGVFVSTFIFFGLFVATYWNSIPGNESLLLVGGGMLTFFAAQPYLLTCPAWRVTVTEEAEALMHSSKRNNKLWKALLFIFFANIINIVYFGCIQLVIDTMRDFRFFVAITFDVAALTFPYLLVGVYSDLSFENVQIIGSLPFLLMVFFSTTLSPGAGIPGLKALRYLFARFYFWCMVPVVKDDMEGCPKSDTTILICLIFASLLGVFLFVFYMGIGALQKKLADKGAVARRKTIQTTSVFLELQDELYGSNTKDRLAKATVGLDPSEMLSTADGPDSTVIKDATSPTRKISQDDSDNSTGEQNGIVRNVSALSGASDGVDDDDDDDEGEFCA